MRETKHENIIKSLNSKNKITGSRFSNNEKIQSLGKFSLVNFKKNLLNKMDGIKSGFFINLFQNTRNNLKSVDIQKFSSFDDNNDCINFVNELCKMEEKLGLERHDREQKHRTDDSEIYFYKDLNCAMEMKKIGNKFFQSQKWSEALNLYNKSYVMIPSDCRES